MAAHFLLLGTEYCHLCDQARDLLRYNEQVQSGAVTVEVIDIAEHSQWYEQYSERIPVFYHRQTQAELLWPFDARSLAAFINAQTV